MRTIPPESSQKAASGQIRDRVFERFDLTQHEPCPTRRVLSYPADTVPDMSDDPTPKKIVGFRQLATGEIVNYPEGAPQRNLEDVHALGFEPVYADESRD